MSKVIILAVATVSFAACTKVDDWRTHCVDFPVFLNGKGQSYRGLLTVTTTQDGSQVGTPRSTTVIIWRDIDDGKLFLRIEPMVFGIFVSVCADTTFVPADSTEVYLDMSGQSQEWVCEEPPVGPPATLVIQRLELPGGGSYGDLQGASFGGELVVPDEPIRYLIQLSSFEYEIEPPLTC